MGNETVAIAKTANKATVSDEPSYSASKSPPRSRLTPLVHPSYTPATKFYMYLDLSSHGSADGTVAKKNNG